MNQIATITSKMQLTIPIAIAKKAGIQNGDKISVSEENGHIVLTPIKQLITTLAGSLTIPKKWQGKNIETIIEEAKTQHFQNKNT